MPPNARSIYSEEEPKLFAFSSRRSTVHSTKGIVACSQPLAARAGIKILDQGGNAADAAVAVAAALNVTEPAMTGIGGDMFCLFYDAKAKKTRALNGSGRSGSQVTLSKIREELKIPKNDLERIPASSVHSVTVPGAAAGWVDTVERFGSGKVSLEQILTPAIELGDEGFPVSKISSYLWASEDNALRRASPNYAEMLKKDPSAKDGYRPPRAGEIFANVNLSNTFRLLAKHGKKGFYEGSVAEALIKVTRDLGGHLTLDDLRNHAEVGSEEVEPICFNFEGQNIVEPVTLWEHPPNGQGLVALMALGILQELEKSGKIRSFAQRDHNSIEYLHAIIEALRLGFSDGSWFIADPNISKVSIDKMLSPTYLAERAAKFSPHGVMQDINHGTPSFSSSDTVYLSVTDPEGNAASFINSVYGRFGTGIIPKGCGFALQNRGANFALSPENHPNILAPNKRPYHTIIPAMVTNTSDGSLHTCYGVMGGFMQPQGHVQVLLNMLIFGMDPQTALDAPRICIEPPNTSGESKASIDEVYIEDGIPESTIDGLRKLGHNVFKLEDFDRHQFGRGQVIRQHVEDGKVVWSAGSDPRGDGQACPL